MNEQQRDWLKENKPKSITLTLKDYEWFKGYLGLTERSQFPNTDLMYATIKGLVEAGKLQTYYTTSLQINTDGVICYHTMLPKIIRENLQFKRVFTDKAKLVPEDRKQLQVMRAQFKSEFGERFPDLTVKLPDNLVQQVSTDDMVLKFCDQMQKDSVQSLEYETESVLVTTVVELTDKGKLSDFFRKKLRKALKRQQ